MFAVAAQLVQLVDERGQLVKASEFNDWARVLVIVQLAMLFAGVTIAGAYVVSRLWRSR